LKQVRPTSTVYRFDTMTAGVALDVTFTTAAHDLDADAESAARPVTYVSFAAASTDGARHDVRVYLDTTAQVGRDDVGPHQDLPSSTAPRVLKVIRARARARACRPPRRDATRRVRAATPARRRP
jgi:hypothetical protein